jgi:hypothetical protein
MEQCALDGTARRGRTRVGVQTIEFKIHNFQHHFLLRLHDQSCSQSLTVNVRGLRSSNGKQDADKSCWFLCPLCSCGKRQPHQMQNEQALAASSLTSLPSEACEYDCLSGEALAAQT